MTPYKKKTGLIKIKYAIIWFSFFLLPVIQIRTLKIQTQQTLRQALKL